MSVGHSRLQENSQLIMITWLIKGDISHILQTYRKTNMSKLELIDRGIYDSRNQLNDLTGKEWLKLTKSVWYSQKSDLDKSAFAHPASYNINDIRKLISLFTKRNQTIIDPFVGSGTTLISAGLEKRFGYGIELNRDYVRLARSRLKKAGISRTQFKLIRGDSFEILPNIGQVDYVVTSPPYHNILKNHGLGVRHDKSQVRQGIEYYSDDERDLGNKRTYNEFLDSFKSIMEKVNLKPRGYCSIIISDFTVNKMEVNSHDDIVRAMQNIGFKFAGTIILVQNQKSLFPFGYPYAFKINHHHQYILSFRKA